MPLFSIGYPATEPGLEGQTKTIQLGVNSLNTMKSTFSLQAPVVEVEARQKLVDQTTMTQKSVPVPPKIIPAKPATSKKEVVPWPNNQSKCADYLYGKVPGYVVDKSGVSYLTWKLIRVTHIPATPAKSIPQPNRTVNESVTRQVSTTENVNVLKSKIWPMAEQSSDNWMNIVFSIDFNTKIGRVYNNGSLLFEYMNLSVIPVNSICTLHFGQRTELIGEVILTNQFCYNPAAFGCFSSQNKWVPKKSVAPAQLVDLHPLSIITPTSL